jgi:hypothetical protein
VAAQIRSLDAGGLGMLGEDVPTAEDAVKASNGTFAWTNT